MPRVIWPYLSQPKPRPNGAIFESIIRSRSRLRVVAWRITGHARKLRLLLGYQRLHRQFMQTDYMLLQLGIGLFCGGGSCSSSQRPASIQLQSIDMAGNGNVDCGGASCSAPDWGGAPSGGSTATCASCGAMRAPTIRRAQKIRMRIKFCTVEKNVRDYGSCGWYSVNPIAYPPVEINRYCTALPFTHWKGGEQRGWVAESNDGQRRFSAAIRELALKTVGREYRP